MDNMGWDSAQVSDAAPDTVELVFQPVLKDFTSALRVRRSVSPAGRIRRWALRVVFLMSGLICMSMLAGGHASVFPVVWAVLSASLIALSPWLVARQVLRMAERNGTFRATVTESGLTVVNDNSSTSVNWIAQPRYKETKDLFVLLTADKNAIGFTVLPKRAARTSADVDRLRALLDRNLTRL